MPQPMYRIPTGSLKGYSVCETCGSVLDIYTEFHQCLLQPDIVRIHMDVMKCFAKCPFFLCVQRNTTVQEYMNHLLHSHSAVIVFSCPQCGIAFITRSGLKEHKSFCRFQTGLTDHPCHQLAINLDPAEQCLISLHIHSM